MALSVRSLASNYSSQYLDKLSKLLLSKGTTKQATQKSLPAYDFELDLEVVYDRRRKVSDIIIK